MKEKITVHKCVELSKRHGWEFIEEQPEIGMISFSKKINGYNARINIYRTKMTVVTALNHPRRGKNQLYRKKVGIEVLEKIFKNPRVHTNNGYRKK